MTLRIDDEFITGNELYATKLCAYPDGDYSVHQVAVPHTSFEKADECGDVYLNKQQAINYAKAILKNEGIHAID